MSLNIAGWYSPSAGRFWTEQQIDITSANGGCIPEDSIPLTFAHDTQRLQQLLATTAKDIEDMTCALESAKAELKDVMEQLKCQ